eukprot:COSAG04_NODE_6294_length_1363_cov_1.106804_2_plen_101_part_00
MFGRDGADGFWDGATQMEIVALLEHYLKTDDDAAAKKIYLAMTNAKVYPDTFFASVPRVPGEELAHPFAGKRAYKGKEKLRTMWFRLVDQYSSIFDEDDY